MTRRTGGERKRKEELNLRDSVREVVHGVGEQVEISRGGQPAENANSLAIAAVRKQRSLGC